MDIKELKKNWGDLPKKKRSTHAWLPKLKTQGLEIHINRLAKKVMTFFFFFLEITPVLLYFSFIHTLTSLIKSRAASQRPAFGKR